MEKTAVRVLKALSIWSIQIFARLFSVVDRCSFLESVKNIGLSILWPRDFPYGGNNLLRYATSIWISRLVLVNSSGILELERARGLAAAAFQKLPKLYV